MKYTLYLNGMNSRLKTLFLAFFMLSITAVNAQLSGTKNIPGDYADLAAAITDLNTLGVMAPGVTLNLLAGNPQTTPAGGYTIGGTGTAILTNTGASPIIIQGNGNTITAFTPQAVGLLNDGIFKIVGADFVTIDNFIMTENAGNTVNTPAASNTMTEWGVAQVYVTTTNGAQDNTIKNCTIDLNRTYTTTVGIYSNSTHAIGSPTTSATATTVAGGNHRLTVTGNTITDVNNGITVVGPTAAADHNDVLTIGGALGMGNTITNYGTAAPLSTFANVSGTVYGVLVRNTKNYNVSYNSITSSNGGVTTTASLRGIYVTSFSNAPTGTITNNVNNNSISLTGGNASHSSFHGISVESTTGNATTSITISNNNFHSWGWTVPPTGAVTFIIDAMANLNTTISNNTFTNLNLATTGSVTFISNSITVPATGSQTWNNNSIVTGFNKTGAGGTVLCFTSGASTVAADVTINHTNNNFSNITVTGATTLTGISNTDGLSATATTKTITGNTFSNWTGGTSTITGMTYSYFGGTSTVSGNTVSNITGEGAITGINFNASGNNGNPLTFTNNTVTNLNSVGTGGTVIGFASSNTSPVINIYNNNINTLSSNGATVNGMQISGTAAANTSIYKNKICNLVSNNASAVVNGIIYSAGTLVTISNNLIGDLRAPISNLDNSVIGMNLTGGTTIRAYFNTVYLSASSSGTNFGSSAISASTTPTLTLRNNIFDNASVSSGTGLSAAYRRSSTTTTSYDNSSDRNIFFGQVVYTDGTNTFSSIGPGASTYKSFIAPRDANSIFENPPFISTSCGSANFLHVSLSTPTSAESGGAAVGGITDDFDGHIRFGEVGYAGTGTAPDIGADEFDGIPLPPCAAISSAGSISGAAVVCAGQGTNLTLSGFPIAGGLTFQWYSGLNSGGPYPTPLGTGTSQSTGAIPLTTYYIVTVTCANDGSTASTAQHEVFVQPLPSVSVSPTSGSYCNPGGTPVTLTASGNSTSYSWAPSSGLSTNTGSTVVATPISSTTYTVTGTLNGCTASATSSITVLSGISSIDLTATPINICSGGSSTLEAVVACQSGAIKLTEITHFSSGTGATPSYPAYLASVPIDHVEISNISSLPVDVSGLVYEVWTSTTLQRTITIPASTILPGNAVMIIGVGTAADDPANFLFNTGGANDVLQSSTPAGHLIKFGATILDAVALTSYSWPVASGVTAADWTGSGLAASGRAGVIRTAALDNNDVADWVIANTPSPLQSIGTYNGGYTFVPCNFDYSWSPATFLSSTTGSIVTASGVTATTDYSVTVTSSNGCSASETVTVFVEPLVCGTLTVGGSSACVGVRTLTVNPSGGGTPYSYVWTEDGNPFGGNTQTILTTAGSHTYVVVVTDACSNTCSASMVVMSDPNPAVSVSPSSSLICLPDPNAVNLTITGDAVSYTWSPTAGLSPTTGTSVAAYPVKSTVYTIVGTGANGCTNSTTATVNVGTSPLLLTASAFPSAVCSGDPSNLTSSSYAPLNSTVNNYVFLADENATLDPMTGATTAISVLEDNTISSVIPIGFTFNFDNVEYTDLSISTDGFIKLGNVVAIADAINGVADATNLPKIYAYWDDLHTGANGYVKYVVTGTAPLRIFKAEWFVTIPRNTTGNANSTFQVWLYETGHAIEFRYGAMNTPTGSSSGGITGNLTTNFQSITFSTKTVSNSTANNAQVFVPPAGSIFTLAPPSATITYAWEPAGLVVNPGSQNTATVGLTSSTVFTVTATNGSCSSTATASVAAGAALVCSPATVTSPNCANTNFDVTANHSGGGAPFVYSWSDGGTTVYPNSQTITANLPAGTYTLSCTVTDDCGASCVSSVSVTVLSSPNVTTSPSAGLICVPGGSSVTITADGTASSYSWSPSSGLSGTTGSSVSANPASTTTYTVVGTDANGCTNSSVSTITVGAVPILSVNPANVNICNGGNVNLSVVSTFFGTITYTTTVDIPIAGTTSGPANPYPATLSVTGVPVGAILKSVNLNGLSHTFPTDIDMLLQSPSGTNVTLMSDAFTSDDAVGINLLIQDGAPLMPATAITSGTYAPTNIGTAADTYIAPGPGSIPIGNTLLADFGTGNMNGIWNLFIVDDVGGDIGSINSWSLSFEAPDDPSVSYTWSPASGLSQSTGSTVTASPGSTTTYTVTGTNASGCFATATSTVNVGAPLVCSPATVGSILCSGTDFTVTANVSGGGPPYSYVWSDGSTTVYPNAQIITANLPAGTYTFEATITDNCGSTCVSSVVVTVISSPNVTVNPTSGQICNPGGSAVTLTASGAVSYTWSPVAGLSSTTGSVVVANPSSTTTYSVTGTDANSCSSIASSMIQVGRFPTMSVTATPNSICPGTFSQLAANADCFLGALLITEVTHFKTGTGETTPYPAYLTSVPDDHVEISNISNSPINVGGLVYEVWTGTAISRTVTIPANTILPANGVLIIGVGTGTDDPGNLYFNTGGTSPLSSSTAAGHLIKLGSLIIDAVAMTSYSWPVASGVTAADWTGNGLAASGRAGVIRTAATDNNSVNDWVLSNEPSPIQTIGTYNGGYSVFSCDFTYSWDPAAGLKPTSFVANPETPGLFANTVYTVTVTSSGCSSTGTVTVFVQPLVCSPATTSGNLCANGNFTVTANHTGGGGPFNYAWSDGIGGVYPNAATITANLPAGVYSFECTVTDDCGNSCVSSVTVTVNALPAVAVNPPAANICNPGGSAVQLTASGASTYIWSPTSGITPTTGATVSASPIVNTTYVVTGTDANGCVNTASSVISLGLNPSVTASATPFIVCPGSTVQLNSSATVPITANTYNFSTGTGTLADMTTASTLIGGLAPVNTGYGDDDMALPNPNAIGFSFLFEGVTYTSYAASPDGWVKLGSAGTEDFTNGVIDNTNLPKIYPFWDDQNIGTDGHLKVLLTGSSPNQILIFEWKMAVGTTLTNPTTTTYQLWMYEGTNVIEFHYGTMANALSASVGITGATNTNYNSASWSTGTSSTTTVNNSNTTVPASGTVYTYTPPAVNLLFSWQPSAGLTPSSTDPNPVTPALNTTTVYTVSVTNGFCTSTKIVTANVAVVDDNNVCTTDGCDTNTGQATHTPVNVDDGDPCTADGCNSVTGVFHTPICNVTLNSCVMMEGFYLGGGLMTNRAFTCGSSTDPLDADQITIAAVECTGSGFVVVDQQTVFVKTDGSFTCTFSTAVIIGQPYYLRITNCGTTETWSAAPVVLSAVTSYSFCTNPANTFAGNIKPLDGTYYGMFSGDVNLDGAIDGSDFLDMDPLIQSGAGCDDCNDLNGDGAVDGSDFLILDPNIQNGIGSALPSCP